MIGTKTGLNERKLSAPKMLKAVNELIELLSYKHVLPFKEKNDSEGTARGPEAKDNAATAEGTEPLRMQCTKEPQAQREGLQASTYCLQALKPNGIGPARFQTCLVLMTSLFLTISSCCNISVCIIPVPQLCFGSK